MHILVLVLVMMARTVLLFLYRIRVKKMPYYIVKTNIALELDGGDLELYRRFSKKPSERPGRREQ